MRLGPWRRAAFAAVLVVAAGGCDEPARAQAPQLRIIDAHVHTSFDGRPNAASGIVDSREQLVADLRRAGVVAAVAHTDTLGRGLVDLHGSRVVHCRGVPASPDTVRLAAELATGRFSCLKVYLGYVHQDASASAYQPVYRLAARHGLPVVFHTGDTWSSRAKLKYAHPLAIDEVAVDHPDVTFVIAHVGYPWYRTAAEVAYKNPNVYLEASALMVGDPAAADAEWLERYVVEPIRWVFGYVEDPGKLMFGSDWPLVDIAGYVDAWKRAIPEEHWPAVFHDNAARVFGLDTSAPVR